MKKFLQTLKQAQGAGRVFAGLWLGAMVLISVAFPVIGLITETMAFWLSWMAMGWIAASAMFLTPALAITGAQRIDSGRRRTPRSAKSWPGTFLLALLFGPLGLHRLYTGHILSGLAQMVTLGGLGIGWATDLVLLLQGRFLDRYGYVVRSKIQAEAAERSRKRQYPSGLAFPRGSLTAEYQRLRSMEAALNGEKKTSARSPGKKGTAPARTKAAPVRREEKAAPEKKTAPLPIRIPQISRERFFSDMRRYEQVVGKEASFVAFSQEKPTYSHLSRGQQAWYFWWRGQVRSGSYPDTDSGYFLLYAYELLSGVGWETAQEGYDRLTALWEHYGARFPELEEKFGDWCFDFAQTHRLPHREGLPLPGQEGPKNLLIREWAESVPLVLPFGMIEALCDYPIRGSKFYKEGNAQLLEEAIPKVVTLADEALRGETGKGLLATFGPAAAEPGEYISFRDALCPEADRPVKISVKPYVQSSELRGYLHELVRYGENVLRGLKGHRGRLRGVSLEAGTAARVEEFLKQEYGTAPVHECVERPALVLDFACIDALREQSNAVRDALAVEQTEQEQPPLSDLEAVTALFQALPEQARTLLDRLRDSGWECTGESEAAEIADTVNTLAQQYLARELLVTEGDKLLVEDDYRDELTKVYENLHREVPAEPVAQLPFDPEAMSGELRGLIESLSAVQLRTLLVLLDQDMPEEALTVIADEAMTMPEMLIDEINNAAMENLDDILIDGFDILEQYAEELRNARKQAAPESQPEAAE